MIDSNTSIHSDPNVFGKEETLFFKLGQMFTVCHTVAVKYDILCEPIELLQI
jgi:hypothetical protein